MKKYLSEDEPYITDEVDLYPYVSNAANEISLKRMKLNPFFKRMREIQSQRNHVYTTQTLFANTLICLNNLGQLTREAYSIRESDRVVCSSNEQALKENEKQFKRVRASIKNQLIHLLTICAICYSQTYTEKHLGRVYSITPFKFKNGFGYHYLSSRLTVDNLIQVRTLLRLKDNNGREGDFVHPSLSCLFALCMGTAKAFDIKRGKLLEEVCLRFEGIGDYPEVKFGELLIKEGKLVKKEEEV